MLSSDARVVHGHPERYEACFDVVSDKVDDLEQQVLAVADFFSKMAVDEDKRLLDCLGDEDNDAAHFHIGRAHAWDDAAGCLRDLIKQYRIPLEEGG